MLSDASQRGEPAGAHGGVSGQRRWRVWLFVGIIVAAVVAGSGWWWSRPQHARNDAAPQHADIAEWEDPVIAPPGYVGMQACAPCHVNRVAEFKATRHFQACRAPKPGEMPEGFQPGKGTYTTRDPLLRFEMTQAGDTFLQTAIHNGPPAEKRTATPIALAYGCGGKLDEVYFTWHGNQLYELPIVWLHPQNRWAMTTYNPFGSGDYARDTTPRCLECHNTWFEHTPGTRNQYNRDHFILGVTCEKCHSPGSEHVAFHQANPNAETAHAVVHPGHLTRERRMEVCTQCHSNAVRPRTRAFQYRPGEPLDDYVKTLSTRHPEDDHVANQSTYLRQSKCFQKSDTLTCVTCHNPHRPQAPAQAGSSERSCLKCHKSADCAEQPRLPIAVRNDCAGCHMPARVWINVHFHTEDDQYVPPIRRAQHRIAVDQTAKQEVLLAWHRTQSDEASKKEAARLTQTLVEHWLAEAENRRREYRFLAAIGALREAMRLDPSAATRENLRQAVATHVMLDAEMATALHEIDEGRFDERRFDKAIESLNRLLAIKPDMAAAHGKLGTAYAVTKRSDLAIKHLQAVSKHDPNNPSGYMMLGWLAYLEGKGDGAVDAYRRADAIEPFNSKTHYHWGLALAQLGQLPEAVSHFRQVLKIDPDHAGALQALGNVLRQQGQPAEALRYALRAARLTRDQNADVLLTLADAYADAGWLADAIDAASKAMAAAQTANPNVVPQIRWRVEEWRARMKKAAK